MNIRPPPPPIIVLAAPLFYKGMVVFIQSHRLEEAIPDSYKSNQALYTSTFKDISHIKLFNSTQSTEMWRNKFSRTYTANVRRGIIKFDLVKTA